MLSQKRKDSLIPYVVQHWNVTYHYTSDNDIPAFNVVGTLLFPHAALYYYTREGAPTCLVVTRAVMHVTLTKPPPQQYLSDSIVPESLLSSASSVNADLIL